MPDDSLIEEMRAALRGDRERAEHRHLSASSPTAGLVAQSEIEPDGEPQPAAVPEAHSEAPPGDAPGIASPPDVTSDDPAPRGLLARLALLRARR